MPNTSPINNATYPVQKRWLFKQVLMSLPIFFVMIVFVVFQQEDAFVFLVLGMIIVGGGINILIAALRVSCFSYDLDEKFLNIRQGVLSKQERHIPYGVIQEITIGQGIADRVLGLAAISITNASQSGSYNDAYGNSTTVWHGIPISTRRKQSMELLGFRGNLVHIPGLLPAHAEELKTALLAKMKEHESDTGAGL